MKLSFKNLLILMLLVILIGTVSSISTKDSLSYFILKIQDGDTVYIDFNNNGIFEKNERKNLSDIVAFESKANYKLRRQMQDYSLTQQEVLELGYLAKELLKKKVLNKKVKVKYTDKNKYYVLLYLDGELVQNSLIESGYVVPYKRSHRYHYDERLIQKAKNQLKGRELFILNLKNHNYHKPDCKYGIQTGDYELIEKKDLPEDVAPCGFCHSNKHFKLKIEPIRKTKIINLNVQNGGSVEFINIRARDYKIPSKETRTEAGKKLIELINNAKNNIYFFSYGLSKQPQIITALENAHTRGVKIKGLIDKNVFGRNDYTGTLKAVKKFPENTIKSDYESDLRKKSRIDNGIEPYNYKFFYGHIMHNKVFVIDNEYIWLGSCNISSTGTGGYNENIVSIIKSKGLSKYFETEFNQMYDKGFFHQDKDEIYSKEPIIFNDNSKIYVYFSPSQKALYEGIIPRINLAKKRIYISMFLITQQDIVNALIKAKDRGVDVKVIVEANHAAEKYSKHSNLRKAGIPVKIENWGGKMHSKAAIIDDNCLVSGSTNWTFTGFKYNDENLLIFDDLPDETVNKLIIEFKNSYNSIPEKWLYGVPKAEGPDSLGTCFDGIDNDHDRLIDTDDSDCAGFGLNNTNTKYDYKRVQPHPKID